MKKKPTYNQTRRAFLKASGALGVFTILPSSKLFGDAKRVSANERVNLAVIGAGGRGNVGRGLFLGTGHCNVVALCDVEMGGELTYEARYQHGLTPPPEGKSDEVQPHKAKSYTDFRVMFDEMADEIDAVYVATPDHSHFAATILAMSLGKHVYVEKPLAHTYGQCQRLIEMAAKNPKLATQMGNQGFSGPNYFQFKAWREAGVIKDITRITASMNSHRRWHGWGTSVKEYPSDADMPEYLDWEFWHTTVAATRPFSRQLHPRNWRSWYEFGSGAFGDWGPHILDSCHHFLELGLPSKIRAVELEGVNPAGLVYPQASTIQFDFPERGPGLPACEVTWYDGQQNIPVVEGEYTESGEPEVIRGNKVLYSKDLVFQGRSHASPLTIIPRQKYKDMFPSLPKFPQKNSNHYANFLLGCKGEETTRSPFSISGPLCQVFCLGMLAQRFATDIDFDAKSQRVTNNEMAQALLDPAPRKGWEELYRL